MFSSSPVILLGKYICTLFCSLFFALFIYTCSNTVLLLVRGSISYIPDTCLNEIYYKRVEVVGGSLHTVWLLGTDSPMMGTVNIR